MEKEQIADEVMENVFKKIRAEQRKRELKNALLGLALNFAGSFIISSLIILTFCLLVGSDFKFNYVGMFMLAKVTYRYFRGGK